MVRREQGAAQTFESEMLFCRGRKVAVVGFLDALASQGLIIVTHSLLPHQI